jgi:probable rRNA maturation factor
MVLIKNTQRKISVNVKKIKEDARAILHIVKYENFDIGIWLTTNKTIQKYNQEYRNKDKPTDILSFSYHPTLKPGERIDPKTDDDKNLGDLIISLEYVQKAAEELHQTLEQRLQILLVHGICHLLGYDHEFDADYKIMHRKETMILNTLKKQD